MKLFYLRPAALCLIPLLASMANASSVTVQNYTDKPLDVVLQDMIPGICGGVSHGEGVVCHVFNDLKPHQSPASYSPGAVAGSKFYASIFIHGSGQIGQCTMKKGKFYVIYNDGLGANCDER